MTPLRLGVPTRVRVELGSTLAKLLPDRDGLAPVQRYVQGLVEDLGLPVQPIVERSSPAESAPPGPPAPPAAMRIWINDRLCRMTVSETPPPDATALTQRINLALHANRDLFVSDGVLDALRDRGGWPSRLGTSPGEIKDAVSLLVTFGINLRRAHEGARAEGPTLAVDAALEKVVTQTAGQFRITVSPAAHAALRFSGGSEAKQDVPQQLRMLNDGLFWELGVLFPLGAIEPDADLTGDEFRVQINDVRMPQQTGLAADEFLVNDTPDRLTLLNVKARETINPANGSPCAIIKGNTDDATCKQAGLTTWDRQDFLILSASAAIRQAADRFLTTDIVDFCCLKLKPAFPDLIARAFQVLSAIFLTRVLRALLHEEISIRDLRSILETLLAVRGRTHVDLSKYIVFYLDTDAPVGNSVGFGEGMEAMVRENAEAVRMAFKRWISNKYTRGGHTLVTYLLDPAIEERLTDPTALAEGDRAKLIQAVLDEVTNAPATAQNPVILTTATVRARLRRELEKEFPMLGVVSYQELSPDTNIQPIARISLD